MVLDFCGDSVVDHCGVRIPLGETLSPLSTILLIACCWWATKCVEAVIRWSLCSKIVLSCVQTQCMWYGIQLLAVFLHVHACRPLTEDTIQEIPNEATEPFCTPQNEHCYVVSRAGQLYSQRYQQPGWKLRVTADWVQLWLAFNHVTGSAVVPSSVPVVSSLIPACDTSPHNTPAVLQKHFRKQSHALALPLPKASH